MNIPDLKIIKQAHLHFECYVFLFLFTALAACKSKDNAHLLPAKAKIEHISKGHITSHGYTGDRVNVSYLPGNSKGVIHTEALVSKQGYREGDSLTIYYDPADPAATVKDTLN